MNVVTKFFRPIVIYILDTHLHFSSCYVMRKPINKEGRWIGWTNEEVIKHLDRMKNYSEYFPKKKPSNGNGC